MDSNTCCRTMNGSPFAPAALNRSFAVTLKPKPLPASRSFAGPARICSPHSHNHRTSRDKEPVVFLNLEFAIWDLTAPPCLGRNGKPGPLQYLPQGFHPNVTL